MGFLSSLPDAWSPSVRLAHPTPVQKHVQTVKNSAVWRGPLSQEAYLRREEYLADQPLTALFGLTYWVLVDTAEPEDSRRVLCGCETIRKRAIVVQDGRTKDTICHCVSNVFCPPEHSGRGYATRMMTELGNALRTYQTEGTATESLFSTLWSDIGKEFYRRLGWELFSSSHICIPAASAAAALSTAVSPGLPMSQPLRSSDLAPLCAADEQGLRKLLSARPESSPPAISLLPDLQTISWHHARERFIGLEVLGKAPEIKGAIIPGPPGQRAWCYWTLTWCSSDHKDSQENILYILRLVVEDTNVPARERRSRTNGSAPWPDENISVDPNCGRVKDIEALLRAAQLHAKLWRMDSVQLWNPTSETVEAARRIHGAAKVSHRDKQGISSMMWFGRDEDKSQVEWFGNEKYGWC